MLGAAEAALTDMGRRLVRGIWYRPLHVVITNRGVHVAQSTVYANIPGHFGGQIAQVVRAAQYAGMSTLWHSHTHGPTTTDGRCHTNRLGRPRGHAGDDDTRRAREGPCKSSKG